MHELVPHVPEHHLGAFDAKIAQEIVASYWQLDSSTREALRTPLERLNLAIRRVRVVDAAIDLGIALEALLLRDLPQDGPISYSMRLRGAWLWGGGAQGRKDTFQILKKVYDLRSKAVHKGQLPDKTTNQSSLRKGNSICAGLIERVIRRSGFPDDWTEAILGIENSEEAVS